MVASIQKAFNEMSFDCLINVFLSLQLCMNEVIKYFGSNTYKVPHIGKTHLVRNGGLLVTTKCDVDAIQQATSFLQVR